MRPGREPLLTRPFLLCAAANLFQGLAFNLYLHLPGFLHELGADEVAIGAITSVTAIASIAARPSVGRAMDARGRRRVVLTGGLVNVLACALYPSVDAIGPWVVAVRILHGLAEALLFTSLFTLAADWVPASRRTEGLALFGVSAMAPISLGGLLGDALLARLDYDALFGASVGFALVSLALSWPLRDRPRARAADEPPSRGFRATLREPDLAPLWLVGTVFSIVLSAVFVFIKTFVMETGIGSVGLFFSAYSLAALGLRLGFGWLPDRVGPKRVLFPALGALALGLFSIARADDARELAAAGVLAGLGHGMTFPILFGLVVSRARESDRGAALSIFTALFDMGVLVGGPAFGAAIRVAGYSAMFALAGGLLVLGALGFAWLDRRSPGASAVPPPPLR